VIKNTFIQIKKLDMFQQTPGHTSQNFWPYASTSSFAPQQPQQLQQSGWWSHSASQPSQLRPIENELIFPQSAPATRFDANIQDGSFHQTHGSESFQNRPIPSLKTRPLNRPKSPPKQRPEDQWQINVDTGRPIKLGGRVYKRITKRKTVAGGEGGESQKSHDQKREASSNDIGTSAVKKNLPSRKDKKIQVDSWSLDLETSDPTSTFKY